MGHLSPGTFSEHECLDSDQISRASRHGPNVYVDVLDKTKCLLII